MVVAHSNVCYDVYTNEKFIIVNNQFYTRVKGWNGGKLTILEKVS